MKPAATSAKSARSATSASSASSASSATSPERKIIFLGIFTHALENKGDLLTDINIYKNTYPLKGECCEFSITQCNTLSHTLETFLKKFFSKNTRQHDLTKTEKESELHKIFSEIGLSVLSRIKQPLQDMAALAPKASTTRSVLQTTKSVLDGDFSGIFEFTSTGTTHDKLFSLNSDEPLYPYLLPIRVLYSTEDTGETTTNMTKWESFIDEIGELEDEGKIIKVITLGDICKICTEKGFTHIVCYDFSCDTPSINYPKGERGGKLKKTKKTKKTKKIKKTKKKKKKKKNKKNKKK